MLLKDMIFIIIGGKMINKILIVIWILDILNMPFIEFLDTTIPINGLAWLLIWLFVLG